MKKIGIKLILLVLLVGLSTGCSSTSAKEKDTLVVGMELAYPPFETKDSEGNPSGISVDFVKDLGKYLGKEVKVENINWDGLIPSLQTNKVDIVMSSMTVTDERRKVVDFSIPYANAYLALLTNSSSDISKDEDLNKSGKVIAVKKGTTGYNYAKEYLPKATINALTSENACIAEVNQGKADAFIYDQLTVYRQNQDNKETTKAVFIPNQESQDWAVAVNKGNEELVKDINEFIEIYKKDGGFDNLTQKYLSKEKNAFDELGFKWFF